MAKIFGKILVVVAVLILIVVVVLGVIRFLQVKRESSPETIAQRLELGKTYYDQATSGLKNGGFLKPEERKALYESAITELEKVAKYQQDNTEVLQKLAVSYYNLKDFNKAIEAYNKILQIDANNAVIHNNLANVYRDLEPTPDYVAAEKHYREAIAKNPQLIVAYTNLASMLRDRLKKSSEAIEVLDAGLVANTNSIDLLDMLASTYKLTGQTEESNKMYQKILELDPNNVNAKEALGL